MNLQDHIKRYLKLSAETDRVFHAVLEKYHELLHCTAGCDECCSVYFELSLIEAFYISGVFNHSILGAEKRRILALSETNAEFIRAAKTKINYSAKDKVAIENAASKIVVPCPLKKNGQCVLYEHRPITCRLYGVPHKIGNRVISCYKNNFQQGTAYETVNVSNIQKKLNRYSEDFLKDLIGCVASTPILFTMGDSLLTHFDKKFFTAVREMLG